MCGFLAFAGHQPDPGLIARLAVEAGRRGPDGSGWATLNAAGWTVTTDHQRPLPEHTPPDLTAVSMVVAHARLATDRGEDPAGRVQPYRAGSDSVVAYNGCLPGSWPQGDTAVLADLVAERGPRYGLDGFLARAAALNAERQAVLAASPRGLWVAQRLGHYGPMPLHVARREEGVYVCSRPFPDSAALTVPNATCLYHGGDHYSIPQERTA